MRIQWCGAVTFSYVQKHIAVCCAVTYRNLGWLGRALTVGACRRFSNHAITGSISLEAHDQMMEYEAQPC